MTLGLALTQFACALCHRHPCSQACNRMAMHCVPLYDSLGENAIEFIINHSEAVVAFVATSKFDNVVKVGRISGVLMSA